MNNDSNLKAREEAKRDAQIRPMERWRLIEDAINFAEANMPEGERRNVPRVPKWNPPLPAPRT